MTKIYSLVFLLAFFNFKSSFSQSVETVIGTTTYDLQTAASVAPRIIKNGGTLSAIWTYSNEMSLFNDRGTGYNYFNGTTWGPNPAARIENVRTGWPSLLNSLGQEFVIAHDGSSGLKMSKRTSIGSGTWTYSDIPNPTGKDLLWPRAVSGGANGQSIHFITVTEPVTLGGTIYNGIDGALLYYRSTNAGVTWDIQAIQLPGSEVGANPFLDQDNYSIFARGDEIIVGVFNAVFDTYVLRSSDNGNTWTKTVLVDFPSELYQIDNWSDENSDGLPDAVFNSDGSGYVFIDSNGVAHVLFGAMYYTDTVTNDFNYEFYRTTDGLMYWREDFGANSYVQVASSPDVNQNGFLDIAFEQIPTYSISLSSEPSMAQGPDGKLYVIYVSAVEDRISAGNQVYRHVFMIASNDGDTWSNPIDITPDANFLGYEYATPSIASVVDTHVHFIVQRDSEPGWSARGDLDPVTVNHIVYGKFEVSVFGCANPVACNYNPTSEVDDGSCSFPGCTNPNACNYDSEAACESGTCVFAGCIDPAACNYNPYSLCPDENLCLYGGCTFPEACNYNPNAGCNDGSCAFPGCTNPVACNYNPYASCDDGSCTPDCGVCLGDMNSDGLRNVTDMLLFLAVFGVECPSN